MLTCAVIGYQKEIIPRMAELIAAPTKVPKINVCAGLSEMLDFNFLSVNRPTGVQAKTAKSQDSNTIRNWYMF